MTLKDFKLSAVDSSKDLTLGEVKNSENIQSVARGYCGAGGGCSGGGGMCGAGGGCSGGGGMCGAGGGCSGG
ncbi:MAG: hypothetical protein IJT73_04560 [Selenomonadaceae bacterium]|nr:hypothetical protein [Selenomonadaceae bacterium]